MINNKYMFIMIKLFHLTSYHHIFFVQESFALVDKLKTINTQP